MTTQSSNFPKTVQEAVDRLLADMSLNDEIAIATMSEEELLNLHFSLGQRIRHDFGLWQGNDALLESCRIMASTKDIHVDDASMFIVRVLWNRIKMANVLNGKDPHGNKT